MSGKGDTFPWPRGNRQRPRLNSVPAGQGSVKPGAIWSGSILVGMREHRFLIRE